MIKIKILTGSVRPTQFNKQPVAWILNIAQQNKNIEVELLDLEKENLPFLNEPKSPKSREYTKDYTKNWSKKIEEGDGFVFVTPEYNHSYSPVLKNAIDYLYHEWSYKPVCYVSYGSLAGGSRAVEHLRGVAAELHMYDLREQIMFSNYWDNLDENGNFKFKDEHVKEAENMLSKLAFWAQVMKDAREKM